MLAPVLPALKTTEACEVLLVQKGYPEAGQEHLFWESALCTARSQMKCPGVGRQLAGRSTGTLWI